MSDTQRISINIPQSDYFWLRERYRNLSQGLREAIAVAMSEGLSNRDSTRANVPTVTVVARLPKRQIEYLDAHFRRRSHGAREAVAHFRRIMESLEGMA